MKRLSPTMIATLHQTRAQSIYRWAGLIWMLFLVYGSVLPLDFRILPLSDIGLIFRQGLATISQHRSATDWLTNVAIFIPLGASWSLARRRSDGTGPRVVDLLSVWGRCMAVSIGIEWAQAFTMARVSSPADLVANGIGAAAGMALARPLGGICDRALSAMIDANATQHPPARMRFGAMCTFVLCGLLLAAWGGLFTTDWASWTVAWMRLRDLQPLPFVRHQAADILLATSSTALAVAAFAPLGAGLWMHGVLRVRRWGDGLAGAAVVGAAVAGVLETIKLFLPAKTPDSGNIVVAAVACAGAFGFAPLAWRIISGQGFDPPRTDVASTTSLPVSGRPHHGGAPHMGTLLGRSGAALCLLAGAALVLHYPVAPWLLGTVLACYAGLLVRYPTAWLLVLPALLPVLDLAPWTGWHYVDEFDAFVLVTLATCLWRPVATQLHRRTRWMTWLPLVGFGISFFASALFAAWPLTAMDGNALGNPYSPYAGLGMAKALLLAGALAGVLVRLDDEGLRWKAPLGLGMNLGLAGASASVIVERLAYAGLADFSAPYRAVGMFSTMQTGGAHLDAYLLVALPFAAIGVLHAERRWQRAMALIALTMGTYAVMVTFSRASVFAMALQALVLAMCIVIASRHNVRRAGSGATLTLVGIVLLAAVVAPAMLGTFMQSRLATTGSDMQVRTGHWRDTYGMVTDDWQSRLFGMGVGSFPRIYQSLGPPSLRPAVHRFTTQDGNTFLRLHSGATVYVEQAVTVEPRQVYSVALRARARGGPGTVNVLLCDRTLLQGYGCESITFQWDTDSIDWMPFEAKLNSDSVGEHALRVSKLSLENASPEAMVDIDSVRLSDPAGVELLSNGDFEAGANRWHFSSPFNHLPWHIKNIWLEVVFNQGWIGLALFVLLIGSAALRQLREALRGNSTATALLSSVLGLLAVGAFDSVLDAPRLVLLLTMLMAVSFMTRPDHARRIRLARSAAAADQPATPSRHPVPVDREIASRPEATPGPALVPLAPTAQLARFVPHLLAMTAGIALVTSLPAVPYNVRELPNPLHPVIAPVLLAMIVFLVFGFPAWAARWLSGSAARSLLFPGVLALHGLATWILLRYAVLPESIHDVIGSPVLDLPWETESIVRMLPLLAWVVMPMVCSATLAAAAQGRPVGAAPIGSLLLMALLLPAQYAVVVAWAGTDNLTELIAANASFGAFAVLALYFMLIGLVASNMALLRWNATAARIAAASVGLLVSLPIGYLLLGAGTEPVLLKHGQVYSALQFMFSADRTHLASEADLLIRFSVFHVAFVLLVAWSQWPIWRPAHQRRGRRHGVRSHG